MKNSMKQIAVLAVLLVAALCFTSSSEPGYDENGQDIDECATILDICPEGYRCLNLPGSYLCEALPGTEVPDQPDLKLTIEGNYSGLFYSVRAKCTGLGSCTAVCTNCLKSYSYHVIGKAHSINGFCVCGSISFRGFWICQQDLF